MASLHYCDVSVVTRPDRRVLVETCPVHTHVHQGAQLPIAVPLEHDHKIEARLDAPADKVAG
jgi:hypothetical protein